MCAGTDTAAEVPAADTWKLERSLLQVFQQEQDTYVRIDWYGNVLFPMEFCRIVCSFWKVQCAI